MFLCLLVSIAVFKRCVILIVVSLQLICFFFLGSFRVFTLSLVFDSFTAKSVGLSKSDDWYLS